jgi:drug/metabolite transporter (DMT)-like permease
MNNSLTNQQQNLRGVAFITFAILIISLSDALVKWMVMGGAHPVQLLALRGWISLVFFLLFIRFRGINPLYSVRWKSHIGRGLIGAIAPILFFLSLKKLPLAEATALFFTSTLMMTILSGLFLKEPVGRHRWLAVLVGFCGVLLITRPGAEAFRIEALYVFGASLAYSILVVSGRYLSRTDSTAALVFYFNVALAIVCTLPMPWIWQPLPDEIWLGVCGFTLLALLGHFAIAQAFKIAPVGVIAPFEYLALVWATLLGFIIWNNLPKLLSFVGMIIIIVSGLYIFYRERRLQAAVGG